MAADANITATARTLGTTELLENIISHVQPDYIPGLSNVCKTWRELINSSPSIQRLVKCLAPAVWESDNRLPRFSGPLPIYDEGSSIAIHPALCRPLILYEDDITRRRITLSFETHQEDKSKLRCIEAEFATRPFCEDPSIACSFDTDDSGAYKFLDCRLHVKGGIRISDLLKACAQQQTRAQELTRRHGDPTRATMIAALKESMTEEDMADLKSVNVLRLDSKYGGWFSLQEERPTVDKPRVMKKKPKIGPHHR